MNIGIIGLGNLGLNLLNFLSEQEHEIYVSDVDGDNVEVIKNSDVIFCCVDTNILPSNFLDIKNVMNVVEDFGVSFEDEVPLYNKIFVICSTLNPGDTKQISEILNPMNLSVCYLPLIIDSDNTLSLETIVIGTIDSHIVNTISDIFQPPQDKKINIVSMTSKSAEIYRLAYSSYIYYKINFANFCFRK